MLRTQDKELNVKVNQIKNMNTEYEATFENIDKNAIRTRLTDAKARLVKKEFTQYRSVFHLPKGHEISGGWARVRDENDKITVSLKVIAGKKIEDQKEICLKVDSYEQAEKLLEALGCVKKAYQESKRELWELDGVEVTIDEWPFLEPYIEIEGKNEASVQEVAQKLGFKWDDAIFGAVDELYQHKYNISKDQINNHTPLIKFKMKNPFLGQ